MKLLIIAAIVAALLLFLYMLSRRFPVMGDGIAFLCVVAARPFVKLQKVFEKAGSYCHTVFEKSLKFHPHVTDDTWHGVYVLSRLLWLVLSYCVIFGEAASTFLAQPALSGIPNDVTLPGGFSVASALLFLCVPATYGAILLETVGLTHSGSGMFARIAESVKKPLRIICMVGVALSILVLFAFWVFRGVFLSDPETASLLTPFILGGLGLTVGGAAIFSLYGFLVGLVGVATCLAWIATVTAHLIAVCISLVASLLDVVALYLTLGRTSVYGDFIGHDPYKVPGSPFTKSWQLSPGQNATAVLPQHAASIVDADTIVPIEQKEMENVPMNPDKNAAILFIGSGFPYQMYTHVAKETVLLDAAKATLSSAVIDPSVNHMQTGIPGVVDMSPPFAKRHAVASHVNTRAETIKKLADDLADTVAQTHQNLKAIPAPVILFSGCYDLIECVDMLESTKRRYPLCKIVVVTEASSLDLQDKVVQVGISDVRALIAEDIVEVLIVTDPNSPVVHEHGLDIQHQYIAKLIMSLVVAATHSDTNVSFADALSALHTCAEVVVMNATSKGVAIGRVPNRFALVPGVKGRIGDGSLPDLLRQCQGCIDDVLTNDETAMYPLTPSDRGSFRVAILDVPVNLSDSRFSVICRENAQYVQTNYPNTLCLTVKGNGVAPLHHIGSRFLVQASCLTPILNPTLIFRAAAPPSTKVTQLHAMPVADPLATNGNVPALPINSTKAVKAPASSRQKKATPARRVVRKNSKQA